jgi:hypothetical protein
MRGLTPFDTERHKVVKQAGLEIAETEGAERKGIRGIDWSSVERRAG